MTKYYRWDEADASEESIFGIFPTEAPTGELAFFTVVERYRAMSGAEERAVAQGHAKFDGAIYVRVVDSANNYSGSSENFLDRAKLLHAVIVTFACSNLKAWEGEILEPGTPLTELSPQDLKEIGL